MYNISILSECNDESIRVAIIAAVNEALRERDGFSAVRMKRVGVNAPVWNAFSRQENLNNKF